MLSILDSPTRHRCPRGLFTAMLCNQKSGRQLRTFTLSGHAYNLVGGAIGAWSALCLHRRLCWRPKRAKIINAPNLEPDRVPSSWHRRQALKGACASAGAGRGAPGGSALCVDRSHKPQSWGYGSIGGPAAALERAGCFSRQPHGMPPARAAAPRRRVASAAATAAPLVSVRGFHGSAWNSRCLHPTVARRTRHPAGCGAHCRPC